MNWQQPYLDYFISQIERLQREQAAMDPIDRSRMAQMTFDDISPERQLRLETLVQKCNEYLQRSNREWDRRELRRRQLQERQIKKRLAQQRLKERERERARKMIEPQPPSLYQRMAAFIRSKVEEEKPQLPKGMYSVQNVQKERRQRSKPLKQSYLIRSKKPTEPNRNT